MRKFKEIITDPQVLITSAVSLCVIVLILLGGIYLPFVSKDDRTEEIAVEKPKGLMLND